MYIALQELYDVYDGVSEELEMTPWYRFIRCFALKQRVFTLATLIRLVEQRLEEQQEKHLCGPECKADQN